MDKLIKDINVDLTFVLRHLVDPSCDHLFITSTFEIAPVFVEIIVENVFQVFNNVFHKLCFNTKLLQYHNFQQ